MKRCPSHFTTVCAAKTLLVLGVSLAPVCTRAQSRQAPFAGEPIAGAAGAEAHARTHRICVSFPDASEEVSSESRTIRPPPTSIEPRSHLRRRLLIDARHQILRPLPNFPGVHE